MHLKRQKAPKNWPIRRKGTAFVVSPASDIKSGLPVLIAMRNVLKIAQNRKEVKKAIYVKNLLLNQKVLTDEKHPLLLFDVLTIVPSKENYRLEISEKGKFELKKISEKEANKKVSKISNKKVLKGKKVQINLLDGSNYLFNEKCKVSDTCLVDLVKNKIEKILELKEGVNVLVIEGKHAGKTGKIQKLKLDRKMVKIKTKEEELNVLLKQIMVVDTLKDTK